MYISTNAGNNVNSYALRVSSGGGTDGSGYATLIGLGAESGGWSKCAIVHTRTGGYDVGDIVFLCNSTINPSDCTMSDEKMRISSSGGVAIGSTNPFSYKLFVNGVTYINGNFKMAGIANIHDNNPYAVPNNYMAFGSLTIGGTLSNYGAATNWSSSTAGLMMECADYTARLSSLMYYDGPLNRIRLGRNKGWGVTETQIEGTLIIAQDRWTLSSEFNQRFYFSNNSTTYYQGYGTDFVNAHEWRNRDGTAIMYIHNNSIFFVWVC